MFEEILRQSHPEIRNMLEAKAAWDKAIANRKECEKRLETVLSELDQISKTEINSYQQVFQKMDKVSLADALKSDSARHLGQISRLRGRVTGLEKIVSIEKQVEASEEQKYKLAYSALFDARRLDFYKPELLKAFAETGHVCNGHAVEVVDIEENEIFEVEIKPRSEVPLVLALQGKQVGELFSVTVQGYSTKYKVVGVRATE